MRLRGLLTGGGDLENGIVRVLNLWYWNFFDTYLKRFHVVNRLHRASAGGRHVDSNGVVMMRY